MIYLVRHGQTEFNAAGRWQGHMDSPLTALGREQAARVGATLRALIDPTDAAIYSSPLGRAHATAQIVANAIGSLREIRLDPRLMEIGMGSWEGLTDYEIEMEWPHARDGLDRHEWFFHSPDGERYEAMSRRIARALREIEDHTAAAKIIVSHGVAGRIVRGIFSGLPRDEALRLDVPQDAIFRLHQGTIERIDCAKHI